MGHLDVPSSYAHLKRSQQAHHLHQLGMGLFFEEYGASINSSSGAIVIEE